MTKHERAQFDHHDEVWELLPWYLNGSLDADEKDLIERHAQVCITCRAELKAQARFAEEIKAVDVEVLATRSAYRALDDRINAAGTAKWSARGFAQRMLEASRLWFDELRIPRALVAATLSIVLAFAIGSQIDWNMMVPGEYRTLTAAEQGASPENRDVRVVFSDRLTIDEVQRTLEPINAYVVEGPSRQGVFRIRIGDSTTGFRDLVAAISALRADNKVIFAEPIFSIPASSETRSE